MMRSNVNSEWLKANNHRIGFPFYLEATMNVDMYTGAFYIRWGYWTPVPKLVDIADK